MSTVSAFLREKTGNMERWLRDEGFQGTINAAAMGDVQLTALAQELRRLVGDAIEQRDWDPLLATPTPVSEALDFVYARPELHDKFWRYLQLFSDTVA